MNLDFKNRSHKQIAAGIALLFLLAFIFHGPSKKAQPGAAAITLESGAVAQCNARNAGPFDGKVLYDCVLGLVLDHDLSLTEPSDRRDFRERWQHRFDNSDMLADQAHTYQAIRSMINDLHEMHTAFLPPKESKAEYDGADSRVEGIGASLLRLGTKSALKALGDSPSTEAKRELNKVTESTPVVIHPAPLDDTPAFAAGLRGGEQILAVDGRPVIGMTMAEVIDSIKGKPGTDVTLTLRVPGSADDRRVTITRGDVNLSQVTIDQKPGGVIVAKVAHFTRKTAEQFSDKVYRACTGSAMPKGDRDLVAMVNSYEAEVDCHVTGIVLDMRGNPGGFMEAALQIGQAFMKSGVILTVQQRRGDEQIEVRQRLDEHFLYQEVVKDGTVVKSRKDPRFLRLLPQVPIVILVDEGSASASEILAGMLQVNGLATVVGRPSFGKEVGQSLIPVDFGAAVKVTTFRFLPGGKPLGSAIIPDFDVRLSDAFIDDPIHAQDAQLEVALEVIAEGNRAIVEAHRDANVRAKEMRATEVAAEHAERDRKIYSWLDSAAAGQ